VEILPGVSEAEQRVLRTVVFARPGIRLEPAESSKYIPGWSLQEDLRIIPLRYPALGDVGQLGVRRS
jgi:hypothetical protein